MHSTALIVAALAALVVASPVNYRDLDLVTAIDVTRTTEIVYVTLGGASSAAASPSAAWQSSNEKHKHWSGVAPAASASSSATTLIVSATAPPAEAHKSNSAPATTTETSSEAAPVVAASQTSSAAVHTAQAAATTADYPTTSSSSSSGSTNTWVSLHNDKRALHQDTGNVEWDDALAASALAHSQQCVFEHSDANGAYGENIAEGTNLSADETVGMWYDEIKDFANLYGSENVPESVLHFTQVVWKSTTKIGCGLASCGSGNYLATCQYQVAGNLAGAYAANVEPLKA